MIKYYGCFSALAFVVGSCLVPSQKTATSDHQLESGYDQYMGSYDSTATVNVDKIGTMKFQGRANQNMKRALLSGRLSAGQMIYKSRCSLCHGKNGHGDGLMSKIITDPAPSNLTLSTLDELDVMLMIVNGGEVMDRSAQMPPWGDELGLQQLKSLIKYLFSIRQTER